MRQSIIFLFLLLLSSCQIQSDNKLANTNSGEVTKNIEYTVVLHCDNRDIIAIKNIPGNLERLIIDIGGECMKKGIPEETWRTFSEIETEYTLFWTYDYKFSPKEYEIIASFKTRTIGGIIPETFAEGKILRSGVPKKLFDPTGANTLYSYEERGKCLGNLPDFPTQLETKKVSDCFLNLE